jgi:amidase
MTAIIGRSASALAGIIRRRDVSIVEVVQAHLEQIARVNSPLNAVVQLAEERALQEAQAADRVLAQGRTLGPLHGVPVTIKDSLDTAGIISTWSTEGRRHFVPEQDAPVVARLRRAGAIILGKTNTPELTLGGEMDSPIYGQTFNPYDHTLSPAGSSGGAAAIIAAGGSPLDLGSDTGGSIREPAHVCGITGIKPTFGRVPRSGHAIPYGMGLSDRLTQVGPMARRVEDLHMALELISGPDWEDPTVVPQPLGDPAEVTLDTLRVAVYTESGLYPPTPEIADAVKAAAGALEDAGAIVEEAAPSVLHRTSELFGWITQNDGGAGIRRQLERAGTEQPGKHIAYLLEEYALEKTPDANTILAEVDQYCSEMLQFMEGYDLIVCPPDAYPALPHNVVHNPDKHGIWGHMYAYNLTGWPAGVVRAGQTAAGLPVGVQCVARPWNEHVVLAAMLQIESALGGYQPPQIA